MSLYNDNEKNDFFENAEIPEKQEEPKKPKLNPEDPRYWEEEEDEFEHLRPSRGTRWKLWFWLVVCGVTVGLLWAAYIRWFTPEIEGATQYGYVEQLARHNGVIDSYEGVLLPYKNLMDSTRVYDGDFEFSLKNDSVAALLKSSQFANRPVRISYNIYRTTAPWRGKTKIMVTEADTVNERNILPPDRSVR